MPFRRDFLLNYLKMKETTLEEYPYGSPNSQVKPIEYEAWDFKSFDKEYIIFIKTL